MSQSNERHDARDGQDDTIGEGNYDASRRYREGVEKSVEKGDATELAKKAARDIEKDGQAYREAEEKGKRAEIPSKK